MVHVSGTVKWGEEYCRVSTTGVIEEWKKGAYALVTLEEVDNDADVCIHVLKKDIQKMEQVLERKDDGDYLFHLEDGKVGYAYYFKSEDEYNEDAYTVYLYQTRFDASSFAIESERNVLLETAKLQIVGANSPEDAHNEILGYWFLSPDTEVFDRSDSLGEVEVTEEAGIIGAAVSMLSDERSIIVV